MGWVVPVVGFLVGVGAVLGGYAALQRVPGMIAQRRIEARIRDTSIAPEAAATGEATLLKQSIGGPLPGVERLVGRTRFGLSMGRLIEQAGVRISVTAFVIASLVSGLVVGAIGGLVARAPWGTVAGLVGIFVPCLVLMRRRRRRLYRFEELFPDALDLLSRAIRAGHGLTTALSMVADEAVDPIGPEFRKTYDEQNFGLPLRDALFNMITRVPLLDVRFFVTALLIQRETGGNLAEILDNLAHVVRERFKVLRQVRVYTAHGRFTGYVLMALPAVLAVALTFISREHMMTLFTERMGQTMVGAAIVMQIVGYLWIKKIVKIEV
jgi:tight adherence protein B